MNKAQFIMISGPPGAGKSTLARALGKELGIFVLDKDCIDEPFSPGDRGENYCKNIEPRVLRSLLALSQLNLGIGLSVIVDLPWTHILINDPSWVEQLKTTLLTTDSALKVIELHLEEQSLKARIDQRGLKRDQVKLSEEGWSKFKKTDHIDKLNPLDHILVDAQRPWQDYLPEVINYIQG